MNPEQENFESLRRLLTLKRHEQPPPGYFNRFSREVIARIEAGEMGADRRSWIENHSWLQSLWRALETKPIMAGTFGAAVCALLFCGIIYSEQSPSLSVGLPVAENPELPMFQASSRPLELAPPTTQYLLTSNAAVPSLPAREMDLFQLLGTPSAQPASLVFPRN